MRFLRAFVLTVVLLGFSLTVIGNGCAKSSDVIQSNNILSLGNHQVMAIEIKNYNPQVGHTFQNIFVSNFSTKLGNSQVQLSSARDGMPDALKISLQTQFGFSPSGPESAVNYFADLLLFEMGITASQQNLLYCPPNETLSTTNDGFVYTDSRSGAATFLGLRDCEKMYLGLNPNSFDNDGDGIPDYLELRCGLNPANGNDAFISPAGDGVSNIDKCLMNIPIDESSTTPINQSLAYNYQTIANPDGSKNFQVSNITILNEGIQNFIVIYIVEVDANGKEYLYTAFTIPNSSYVNQTLSFPYWATSPADFYSTEILAP